MFKDLKEYQEITQIYHDSVNISEEQRIVNDAILEEGFTLEEIEYLEENFDELWETEFCILTEQVIEDTLVEENLNEEQLQEIKKKLIQSVGKKIATNNPASGIAKAAPKATKGIGGLIKKGLSSVKKAIPQGVKDTVRGAGSVAKSAVKKVGGVIKKAAPKVVKALPKMGVAGLALGGAIAGLNALRKRGKAAREKEAAISKQELNQKDPDDPTSKSNTGAPEYEPKPEKKKPNISFADAIKGGEKLNAKPSTASGKDIPKPRQIGKEKGQINPNSARGKMISRNVEKFGKERVKNLRDKNAAFQASKRKDSGYTRADFIKDFPNSNAAKEANKRKSRPNVMDYESFDPSYDSKTANKLAEVYKNMYNTPSEESEKKNLDEGAKREIAKKAVQGVKKVGKLIKQGVREKGFAGGPQKPTKGFYNVKAGPNSQYDYSGTGIKKVRPEGGGSRRVKATYGKKPEKTFMQSQKDKLEAQRQGVSVKELDASRKAETAAAKDAFAKAEAPRSGIDPRKGKKATKRTSFQDKDFKPKYENYEPYDVVLEYLLSTEQAATIEEANYIMTEMDAETIQGIVSEGLGSAIKKVGKTVGDAVKKGAKKVKGREMMGDFPTKGGKAYSV